MSLQIAAIEYLSLSEIQTVAPHVTKEFIEDNPEKFSKLLYELGMETNLPVEEQFNTHRNRFGNVITTYRWVGNSRIDKEWCNSGYASCAAIDKSKNNSLLIDCYRLRGEVESV